MHKFGFLAVSVLLLIAGCGSEKPKFTDEELTQIPLPQRIGLPECSGGFVLAVSGETISADEITVSLVKRCRPIAQRSNYEQFREQVRPGVERVLISKVSNILLYQKARKEAGEDIDEALEKAAEREVRRFIVSFKGDSAKAEQALKEMGMDWADFKEYQKRMVLSQSYIQSKMPEKKAITYSELMDGYNRMKDEFFVTPATLKFRLIDIEVAKLEVSDPNRSRLELARELADELMRRLQAGEDFGELALTYSQGHRRRFGGLWKPVQPDSLAEPYDILAAEAELIEPGQLAGPIEADGHIFIMKLVEKRPEDVEPFEKVQEQVKAKIIFERRKRAVDELTAELARQAVLNGKDEFIEFCTRRIYLMSNQ